MTRLVLSFLVPLSLSVVIGCTPSIDDGLSMIDAGPPAVRDNVPVNLTCESISLCSTYTPSLAAVDMPATLGGTVQDGIYRVVGGGTNVHIGLVISNGKFSSVFHDLRVAHGDITFSGTTMTQVSKSFCRFDITNSDPEFETTGNFDYAVDGDKLYTRSFCGSIDPEVCSKPSLYQKVNSLCEDLSVFSCSDGNCSCAVHDMGVIPAEPSEGARCDSGSAAELN